MIPHLAIGLSDLSAHHTLPLVRWYMSHFSLATGQSRTPRPKSAHPAKGLFVHHAVCEQLRIPALCRQPNKLIERRELHGSQPSSDWASRGQDVSDSRDAQGDKASSHHIFCLPTAT